jgi:hypothetical protein
VLYDWGASIPGRSPLLLLVVRRREFSFAAFVLLTFGLVPASSFKGFSLNGQHLSFPFPLSGSSHTEASAGTDNFLRFGEIGASRYWLTSEACLSWS